jgi:hypothetical protein
MQIGVKAYRQHARRVQQVLEPTASAGRNVTLPSCDMTVTRMVPDPVSPKPTSTSKCGEETCPRTSSVAASRIAYDAGGRELDVHRCGCVWERTRVRGRKLLLCPSCSAFVANSYRGASRLNRHTRSGNHRPVAPFNRPVVHGRTLTLTRNSLNFIAGMCRGSAYSTCLGQALEEVDPVANPLVGEPGSALFRRR